MTLQQLSHPIFLPGVPRGFVSNGTASFTALGTLDSDGEKLAQVFPLPKIGNISKVHFRVGTVSTGEDVLVRLETVTDADGDPSGNLWGTDTEATVTISAGDTWYTAELTADAAIASGDVGKPIAIVVEAPTGFTAGGGTLEIDYSRSYYVTGKTQYDTSFWARKYLTGSWTTIGFLDNYGGAIRLEYDDGSFGFLQSSYVGDSNSAYVGVSSTSSPDELGIKLRVPIACRAIGVWLNYLHRIECNIKVYDSSDVEKMTNMPIRRQGWLPRDTNYKGTYFSYGDTLEVIADEWYRITTQPLTTGTPNNGYYIPQATAAHWAIYGLNQDDYKWTERTDNGAWTDKDGRILFCGWIIDQIHDGAGGGGGTTMIQTRRNMLIGR